MRECVGSFAFPRLYVMLFCFNAAATQVPAVFPTLAVIALHAAYVRVCRPHSFRNTGVSLAPPTTANLKVCAAAAASQLHRKPPYPHRTVSTIAASLISNTPLLLSLRVDVSREFRSGVQTAGSYHLQTSHALIFVTPPPCPQHTKLATRPSSR